MPRQARRTAATTTGRLLAVLSVLVVLCGLLGGLVGGLVAGAAPAGAQTSTTTADPTTTTTFDQSLTTTPPLDADNAPDYDNTPDLDMDRITGPRVEDGVVTSTTFWPLGIAAVAILVVFGTIFYRAARGKKGNQAKPRSS